MMKINKFEQEKLCRNEKFSVYVVITVVKCTGRERPHNLINIFRCLYDARSGKLVNSRTDGVFPRQRGEKKKNYRRMKKKKKSMMRRNYY